MFKIRILVAAKLNLGEQNDTRMDIFSHDYHGITNFFRRCKNA
ncbi:hypothetical protein THIOSC15_1980005 [uncultured Thiomicrorhabdus sp.]